MSDTAVTLGGARETGTGGSILRLLSYNIQVGIRTRRARQYLTNSWKHVLPHANRFENLDRVAQVLRGYDIVGLQEVDAGSLRSNFVNLTEYLATQAGFPYWHHRVNRRIGHFAQHASGLLSRVAPAELREYGLPGLIPGRGVTLARYGRREHALVVLNIHLSLSRRARQSQLARVAEIITDYPHAVVMGDMNCAPDSPELRELFRRTRLREPLEAFATFPSWQPQRNIDHILVTEELAVTRAEVLTHSYSDHLPISMDVRMPEEIGLVSP